MNIDGCKVEYTGLIPTEGAKHEVSDLIQKIQASAPSDSNILVHIEQTALTLSGSFKISATCGQFTSAVSENTLTKLCKRMEKEINGQLTSWKKERFL